MFFVELFCLAFFTMNKTKKSRFEIVVVTNVANLRRERGFTQSNIASILNVSRGFIGQVESINSSSTYSLNQLNRLAYEFECNLYDFFPEKPIIEEDWE